MASRKTRAKRRQERIQQLQRNTAMPPAQERIEELKATNPLEAQQTLLPDEREIIPAKEVEQRIECVPLERIVTEQYGDYSYPMTVPLWLTVASLRMSGAFPMPRREDEPHDLHLPG